MSECMPSFTRREFLEFAARRSTAAALAATALLNACGGAADAPSALGLDARATRELISLIDEIIPKATDHLAASEAGTLAYLEHLAPAVPEVRETLRTALDHLSKTSRGARLDTRSADERVAAVQELESSQPQVFGRLRAFVYEAYYLQPRVWAQLGYEPFPTIGAGPTMAPFDPGRLEGVRRRAARSGGGQR